MICNCVCVPYKGIKSRDFIKILYSCKDTTSIKSAPTYQGELNAMRVVFATPARWQVNVAKLMGATMWCWIFWRFKQDWRELLVSVVSVGGDNNGILRVC